jgi:opine dehydrogenase
LDGVAQIGLLVWMLRFYGHQGMKGATLHEALSTTPVHGASRGPSSLDHRYFPEDVPYGLVPMAHLADAAGVPVPNIKAMIHISRAVAGQDFWGYGMGFAPVRLRRFISRGDSSLCDYG